MARVEWTISNVLTVTRILLLIPILYLLLDLDNGNRLYAAAFMLVVALTDFLDGRLARRFQQETEFGKIIDPLADKICAGAVVIALAALGDLPAWFMIALIGRDTLILLGGLYIAKTKNVILHSNWAGKGAMGVVAAFLIVATLRFGALEAAKLILLWGSVGFLGLSFVLYCKRFYQTVLAKPRLIEPSP